MTSTKYIIYWSPRILSILFICFLTLFSFDVFEMNGTVLDKLIGFFMHNIPSMILTISLIISWKHELVGVVMFALTASLYVFITTRNVSDLGMAMSWSMIIAGPALLISLLFLIAWRTKRS